MRAQSADTDADTDAEDDIDGPEEKVNESEQLNVRSSRASHLARLAPSTAEAPKRVLLPVGRGLPPLCPASSALASLAAALPFGALPAWSARLVSTPGQQAFACSATVCVDAQHSPLSR